ncbi:MAG TPA: PaaI family thioesterase [Acidimicrobiia bacterium]|nr:PaaI family thioesterase [Acidimicrobiia bacterium]
MSEPRTRTITWEDPRDLADAALKMDGSDFLAAMVAGDLPRPPIAETLDFRPFELGDGEAVFELVPREFHYNPIGTVHGGVIATLLDSALGCAVQTRLPQGTRYTTLELKVNFVRAVLADTGRLRFAAKVIHLGGRVATAEAQALDDDGRLYAHATTTCLVMRPEGSA